MLIFRKKCFFGSFFFFLNYNFNPVFYFLRIKIYLIRLGVFLTFLETITNFLNTLNIQRRYILKTKVIKLLIIYLILKNKYINIQRGCGLCSFLIMKLQTALLHAVRCTITYGAMRCSYAILQAVLVPFLRFGEHPSSPHLIFVVTCAVRCIRCGLKPVYFSNFELFLPI